MLSLTHSSSQWWPCSFSGYLHTAIPAWIHGGWDVAWFVSKSALDKQKGSFRRWGFLLSRIPPLQADSKWSSWFQSMEFATSTVSLNKFLTKKCIEALRVQPFSQPGLGIHLLETTLWTPSLGACPHPPNIWEGWSFFQLSAHPLWFGKRSFVSRDPAFPWGIRKLTLKHTTFIYVMPTFQRAQSH